MAFPISKERKSSRGSRTDGAATRARILESAGELISEHGLAKTTSKAVAERAGVDLASINYHFGSRDGLYEAVLIEAHGHFMRVDELQALADGPERAEDKLRTIITVLADRFLTETHWSSGVLAREFANQSRHIDALFDGAVLPKLTLIKRIISQITGIPEDRPEVFQCAVSAFAPCAMLFIAKGRFPAKIPAMDQSDIAQHLYSFALAGLQAGGRDYAQRQELAP